MNNPGDGAPMLKNIPLSASAARDMNLLRRDARMADAGRFGHEGLASPRAELMLVNLGCGTRIHPRWINFDLFPAADGVIRANFLRGIPLRDAEADVVYHSHVLEHLAPDAARDFLAECRRVLRPGGIMRVVVPDLEQTVREYIAALDGRRSGTRPRADHHWMLVELLDQLARASSGGAFASFAKQYRGNDRFVLGRLGIEGPRMLEAVRASGGQGRLGRLLRWVERMLPSPWGEALSETYFRTRGEVHKWMYDSLSLGDLLVDAGFVDVECVSASASSIPDWAAYRLDAGDQCEPWKPVSLYMEGRSGA